MPGATGPLNGSGPQEVYAWLSYHSRNIAGNYTTWYYEAVYKGNGYGSWSGGTQYWSLSGFAVGGGTFTIPSPGTGDVWLGSGTFNKGHNAQGYLSAGVLTVSVDTNHSAIGDGSVGVSSGAIARIPKPPGLPGQATFRSSTPDSIEFQIYGPSDNGGSAITTYLIKIYTKDELGAYVFVKSYNSGASIQSVGDLSPATDYYVQYNAINAYGTSNNSIISAAMTTESGIYVSDGTNWVGAGPRVSDGDSWEIAIPTISDGDSWEQPLDI